MTKYLIKSGSNIIYDSSQPDLYPVVSPSISIGLRDAGSAEFTLLPNHPLYLQMQQMKTRIAVYRDETELFYGRIINLSKNLHGELAVSCEGAFTFFLDSEIEAGEVTETIPEFIARCITAHNSQVEAEKQFAVGQITADKAVEIDPRTGEVIKITFKNQDYSNTKSVLESLIVSKYGGYFRVRQNPNGPHFLDYVQSYGRTNTQRIKIAENVVEKTDQISGESIFSILRPLGKDNLTIDSLTQSDVTLPNVTKNEKLLVLNDMVTLYGKIIRTERFGDIDEPHTLLKAAEEYISRRGTQLPASIEIGYVDWHFFNPEVMDVMVGDTFTDIDNFSGVELTVSELNLDLADISNDKMTLENMEQLASSNPTGTAGGLSASYASQCQHIDYIYKYIREEDNLLLLNAERIETTSRELDMWSEQVDIIAGEVEAQGETLSGIEGSALWLNRNNITAVTGSMHTDQQGNIVVNSGVGLKIERNEGGQVSSFGVYDTGNLTGGILVQQINSSDTLVQILASKINFSGYVTANELETEIVDMQAAYANYISTSRFRASYATIVDCEVDSLFVGGYRYAYKALNVVTDIVNGAPVMTQITYLGQ